MVLTTFLFFLYLSHYLSRFARLAATTFITQGIPVYLFSDITPTPFVVSSCFIISYHGTGVGAWLNRTGLSAVEIQVSEWQKSSQTFIEHPLFSPEMFLPRPGNISLVFNFWFVRIDLFLSAIFLLLIFKGCFNYLAKYILFVWCFIWFIVFFPPPAITIRKLLVSKPYLNHEYFWQGGAPAFSTNASI